MRQYTLTKIAGKPAWEHIPEVSIDHYLWSDVRSIVPTAQAAWDEDALYIRLQAKEEHIRQTFNLS